MYTFFISMVTYRIGIESSTNRTLKINCVMEVLVFLMFKNT